MNKLLLIFTSSIFFILFSCKEFGSSYEQITDKKTISQRVNDINKSITEVKGFEKKLALSKELDNYLEYEYPIRENEFYTVSYRFDDTGCFEIGLDAYFNRLANAQNVIDGILLEINNSTSFKTITIETGLYRYVNKNKTISLELDSKNIKKGMVSITIFAQE